ncbi:MAG: hypothetical protein ACD_50C00307G0007 [uncultured bacterium]|nr:MAG: hypothetical protein ACD_50C00307G0007 [uncultured bacterium]OGH14315.1 MAG: hypothetical protein A2687_01665 [Candidatus Levybacteria bacterium RIFCSPHIGHO2_01_FULL_38_26]
MTSLLEKIESKTARIGVVGLGYVGLPLAILFAKKGFSVTGFVRSKEKKDMLSGGKSYIQDDDIEKSLPDLVKKKKFVAKISSAKEVEKQDVIVICVPTPVTEGKKPDLTDLEKVAKQLSQVDLTGKLIVNESTVAPFTTRDVLGGFKSKYFLVCSPERVDPGNKKRTTEFIPKVIGGKDKESLELARRLYEQVLKAEVVRVKSMEAAEMAKMLENSYRAVNIALVNEFSKLAEKCGIDILDVLKAASTKWTFQAHYPSIGVGGHCIPVDPYYVLELALQKKLSMSVLEESLLENERMPEYILEKLMSVYKKGDKILIYGLTYKKDVGDLRESPVLAFCSLLSKNKIPFFVYDPFVLDNDMKKLELSNSVLEKSDIFVVGTAHSTLSNDYRKAVGPNTIVIDGQNFFDRKVGKKVIGIGRAFL